MELLQSVDWEDWSEEPLAYPVKLAGDKAYRAEWIDEWLMASGIEPVIPSKGNQDRGGRPVEFDRDAYRERNIVERLIGWLKESRRVMTRFEKTVTNFLAMVKWAFVKRYLRLMKQFGFSACAAKIVTRCVPLLVINLPEMGMRAACMCR